MKYQTPDMEIVAIGVNSTIAADDDFEISIGVGDLLSKIPTV